MHPTFRRKPNRLPLEVYGHPSAYSITTVVKDRRSVFGKAEMVDMCLQNLSEVAARTHFEVVAYCFMPDHLHLLVQSTGEGDLVAFMRLFKQKSGHAYHRSTGDSEVLWQKSYYDHVLRREEDLHDAARYIWGNPVRVGLVEDARHYPYSGSFTLGEAWRMEG